MTMLSADSIHSLYVHIIILYFLSMQLSILTAAGLVETSLGVRQCLICLIPEPVVAQKCDNKPKQLLILFCLGADNLNFFLWCVLLKCYLFPT